MQFLVTLAVSLASTGLVSRILFLMLWKWDGGFNKPAAIHVISLAICWMLFVIWCSTNGKLYWFAGHVVFLPQCGWFTFDLLRSTGEHEPKFEGAPEKAD